MTLPVERLRAVSWARKFLRNLMDSRETPRVPKDIRRQAYSVLKHFPSDHDLERAAAKIPDIFMTEEQDKEYWATYHKNEKKGK